MFLYKIQILPLGSILVYEEPKKENISCVFEQLALLWEPQKESNFPHFWKVNLQSQDI